MSFEVTVTPTVYNVEVEVNPSVQPFDVQVITQQDLADLVDEAKQYAEDAEDSADSASASASSASASASASASSANSASASASSASSSANTATTQAGIATTQAGIATTQAGIATTKAQEASQSASDALASEQASAQSASDALQSEQNALASEQASALSEANALASEQSASASASTATAQAGIATTQAGIATAAAASIVPVTIGTPANGLSIDSNQVLSIGLASGSTNGALSSTDWTTFNAKQPAIGYTPENVANKAINLTSPDDTKYPTTLAVSTALAGKQNTLTNPITGTGTSGQVAFWSGTGSQTGNNNLFWDSVNLRLGVGTNAPVGRATFFTGLSGNTFNLIDQLTGSIAFSNNAALLSSPTLSGKSNDGIGLSIISATNNTNANPDLVFNVRENDNTDFATLTTTAFRFSRFGTTLLNILRSGSLGILTDSPTQTLDVNGTGRIRNGVSLADTSGNVQIGTTTDAGFRLDVNGTARVQGALTTNLTAGRVPFIGTGGVLSDDSGFVWDNVNKRLGIGVAPSFPLDVNGSVQFRGSTVNVNITTNNGGARYVINGATIGRSFQLANNWNIGGAFEITPSTTGGGSTFSTPAFAIFGGSSNVVIGQTTDAGFRLDVNGSTRFNGLSTIQGTTASDSGQLGSELLTTGTGDASWTGSSFATGYTHVAGSTTTLTSTLAGVVNNFYQITYTVTGRTAGSFTVAFGGQSFAGLTATGAVGPRATTTDTLVITPTSDFNGTIVLSIRVISISSASVTLNNSSGAVTNQIRISSFNTNTFIGRESGRNNTTGLNNSSFGANALRDTTTGFSNTSVGSGAMLFNTTGSNNTSIGFSSLQNNTTGVQNTVLGASSLSGNTTGIQNTTIGALALTFNTTGNSNIAIGVDSGRRIANASNLTIANNSIFIGQDSRANADNETNQIVIGHTAIGLGSNTTVIGNSSTTFGRWWGNLLIGTSTNQASSVLTMESTTRGFLPPRMTSTERNAIATPATGLVVYNTTDNRLSVYNGTAWVNLATV